MTKKDELDEQTAKQLSLSIVDMCRTVLRSVKKNDLADRIEDVEKAAEGVSIIVDINDKYGLGIGYWSKVEGGVIRNIYKPITVSGGSLFRSKYCPETINFRHCYIEFLDEEKAGNNDTWHTKGSLPKNEWVLKLSYDMPDKPRIDRDVLYELMDELYCYHPDFVDSHNLLFCWRLENAKKIYKKYPDLLGHYIRDKHMVLSAGSFGWRDL